MRRRGQSGELFQVGFRFNCDRCFSVVSAHEYSARSTSNMLVASGASPSFGFGIGKRGGSR